MNTIQEQANELTRFLAGVVDVEVLAAPLRQDGDPRMVVYWDGVDASRVSFGVQIIVGLSEYQKQGDVFVSAWNALAGSPDWTPVLSSVSTSYDELPVSGTKNKNFVEFSVLGCSIDVRGLT